LICHSEPFDKLRAGSAALQKIAAALSEALQREAERGGIFQKLVDHAI